MKKGEGVERKEGWNKERRRMRMKRRRRRRRRRMKRGEGGEEYLFQN